MSRKLLVLMTLLCTAAASAGLLPALAAGPPLPVNIIPNTAQERLQAQAAIQQAQAQARIAAAQAKVQAQLDANQARLEGQVTAQQAGTQAQLDSARQSTATAAQLAALSLPVAGPMQGSLAGPVGTMQLTTLTPQLGRYFGTNRGVLVVRAPTHGILALQDGDVILSIGGRTPASPSQTIRILTSYDPGEKIRLVILREHHRLDISATLPASPARP
ncbi:MAG TPA: PDZ domain-containing protein [Steroidobacteraceae bacterium]|jgi:S1-C subfamily serine protease|nr:PDZ domain-containing protein [Steroidobacteraceae bacterium]